MREEALLPTEASMQSRPQECHANGVSTVLATVTKPQFMQMEELCIFRMAAATAQMPHEKAKKHS